MEITSFKLSDDRTKLEMTISDATGVISLNLWTDKTYRDFNKLIDLSSKLTGSAVENITITPADLNESYFDGVYFVEAKDSDETSTAIAAELNRFRECILDKLIDLPEADSCLEEKNINLLNSHIVLLGLQDAITLQFPTEILTLKKALDKYCSNTCRTCSQYTNIKETDTSSNNDPSSIDIIIDGGSLD